MKKETTCPVCGTNNIRTYYTDVVGLTEDYYQCCNCGYFSYMCYSPESTGICMPDEKRKKEIRNLYGVKIDKLGLTFISPDCMP